jgi:hypothetical protein
MGGQLRDVVAGRGDREPGRIVFLHPPACFDIVDTNDTRWASGNNIARVSFVYTDDIPSISTGPIALPTS